MLSRFHVVGVEECLEFAYRTIEDSEILVIDCAALMVYLQVNNVNASKVVS